MEVSEKDRLNERKFVAAALLLSLGVLLSAVCWFVLDSAALMFLACFIFGFLSLISLRD